jgi:ribosomal protein S18 acetylase RimI-like enzyme
MNEPASPQLRIVESFPEPEFAALRNAAFADFGEHSILLADMLAEEADRHSKQSGPEERIPQELRVGAFIDDRLIAWSYSKVEGSQLHMVNSGVIPDLRRRGIYSRLVEGTITYAETRGFSKIFSRHVPSNNAVIIPKLRLGFILSGFEYSEVYGPLVHLTYLIGDKRRELYRLRSVPIVPTPP